MLELYFLAICYVSFISLSFFLAFKYFIFIFVFLYLCFPFAYLNQYFISTMFSLSSPQVPPSLFLLVSLEQWVPLNVITDIVIIWLLQSNWSRFTNPNSLFMLQVHLLIVIMRLMLSVYHGLKVITLSGLHCVTSKLFHFLLSHFFFFLSLSLFSPSLSPPLSALSILLA